MLSVQGMMATTAASVPLFVFGPVSDRFGLDVALLALGAGVLVLGVALTAGKPRREERSP